VLAARRAFHRKHSCPSKRKEAEAEKIKESKKEEEEKTLGHAHLGRGEGLRYAINDALTDSLCSLQHAISGSPSSVGLLHWEGPNTEIRLI